MSDREWYAAILAGDATPFIEAAKAIADAIAPDVDRIVVDAVEHFNPLHDLASAVGARVVRLAEQRWGRVPLLLHYPIERPGRFVDTPAVDLRLGDDARERKMAAAAGYGQLAQEVERVVAAATPERFSRERIDHFAIEAAFPLSLPEEPYYESFGRRRIEAGLYRDLITYDNHVRPLVQTICVAAGS